MGGLHPRRSMSPSPTTAALSQPTQTDGASSAFVAALEQVWAEITRRHPDVPPVIVTVGAGSIRARPGSLILGHYAAARWQPADPGTGREAIAELFIGGEGLRLGAVEVLGTLLHEAAHGVASTRKVKDTSRRGAYHNSRYKLLAEELGLQIDRDPTIGWSLTTVPAATIEAYADQVAQLRAAIRHVRQSEYAPPAPAPGDGSKEADPANADETGASRSAPTYLCACPTPRRLRMARTVYEQAPVLCGACLEPFQAREAE